MLHQIVTARVLKSLECITQRGVLITANALRYYVCLVRVKDLFDGRSVVDEFDLSVEGVRQVERAKAPNTVEPKYAHQSTPPTPLLQSPTPCFAIR